MTTPHLFFPGRQPLLSLAELSTYFSVADFESYGDLFWEIRCSTSPKTPGQMIDNLGGITKIAQVLMRIPIAESRDLAGNLEGLLVKDLLKKGRKNHLGLSCYKIRVNSKKLLAQLKNNLKKKDFSIRMINQDGQNVSTAQIIHEKLTTDRGLEIVLAEQAGEILVAKTVAVQDIEKYSKRDYDRPGRDARRGMLPPKLAQIMLNLGGFNSGQDLLWDPFCGTGVVLLEGLLQGFNMLGSDLDEKAVALAEKNVLWLYEQFGFAGTAEVWPHDAARKLPGKRFVKKINGVVTEPFLGPPLSRSPNLEKLNEIRSELTRLYVDFLRQAQDVLAPGARVVMIWPCWRIDKKWYFLEKILAKAERLGYNSLGLIPQALCQKFGVKNTARGSLIYSRPDQVVGREIVCLEL